MPEVPSRKPEINYLACFGFLLRLASRMHSTLDGRRPRMFIIIIAGVPCPHVRNNGPLLPRSTVSARIGWWWWWWLEKVVLGLSPPRRCPEISLISPGFAGMHWLGSGGFGSWRWDDGVAGLGVFLFLFLFVPAFHADGVPRHAMPCHALQRWMLGGIGVLLFRGALAGRGRAM